MIYSTLVSIWGDFLERREADSEGWTLFITRLEGLKVEEGKRKGVNEQAPSDALR